MQGLNKKSLIVTIVAAVLLVAIVLAVVIVVRALPGKVEKKDGLMQNSKIYIDNVSCDGKTVTYTWVNKTGEAVKVSDRPNLQKKVGNDWVTITVPGDEAEGDVVIEKRSELEDSFTVDRWVGAASGANRAGEDRLAEKIGDDLWMVGYFTIA